MRVIRFKEVKLRTGLSRATIYRRVKSCTFPRPLKLDENGRRNSPVGWLESEIDQFIAAARDRRDAKVNGTFAIADVYSK